MSSQDMPLAIRIGKIRHHLDARSDGTSRGYRAVIGRDLRRYWTLIETFQPTIPAPDGRRLLEELAHDPDNALLLAREYLNDHVMGPQVQSWALADALERALVLVQHYDVTPTDALKAVRLTKE